MKMEKFVQRSPKPPPKSMPMAVDHDDSNSVEIVETVDPTEKATTLTPMNNSTNSPRRASPVKCVEPEENPTTPAMVRKRPPLGSVATSSTDEALTPDPERTRNHGKRPRLETPADKRALAEQKREEARLLREQQKRERDDEKQRVKEAAQKERDEKKKIETAEREEKKRIELVEREEKRKVEAAERERIRLERDAQKEKARVDREHEREEARLKKETEKEEHKKIKEEERESARLAKEADKERVRVEKVEAIAKEEAAKRQKIQGSVNIMASFVSKAKTSTPSTPKTPSTPSEGRFGVFQVKEGVLMAPCTRRPLGVEEKTALDRALVDDNVPVDRLYVSLLRDKTHAPLTAARTLQVEVEEDIIQVDNHADAGAVRESYTHRTKYLHFHLNYRPPYYGTWRKRSTRVTGRRPFGTDTTALDYDVESDDEWDDEPDDAETLSDVDNESQSDDDGDVLEDDGFEVEHGYLSDGEGEDDADTCTDPEERRLRMSAKAEAWRLEHDPNTLLRHPMMVFGPWYPDADGKYDGREACLVDKLAKCQVFVIGPPMTSFNWEAHAERIEGPSTCEVEVEPPVVDAPVENAKRTPKSKSIKAMFANKSPAPPKPKAKKRIQLQAVTDAPPVLERMAPPVDTVVQLE